MAEAKARPRLEAAALAAKLDAQLAESEAQIAAARRRRLAAIKPVAAEAASTILLQTDRQPPGRMRCGRRRVDDALAARKAA